MLEKSAEQLECPPIEVELPEHLEVLEPSLIPVFTSGLGPLSLPLAEEVLLVEDNVHQ